MLPVLTFLQHLVTDRLHRDEEGQSSVEYLGIVVVAAAIIVVLIGLAEGWGTAIGNGITNAINSISG